MTQLTQKFAIADPKTFEGDPYEVAERAAKQAAAVVKLARQTTEAARVMIRNADLERQLALTGECDVQEFEESALAQIVDQIVTDTTEAERKLMRVAQSVSFNPKARIGR